MRSKTGSTLVPKTMKVFIETVDDRITGGTRVIVKDEHGKARAVVATWDYNTATAVTAAIAKAEGVHPVTVRVSQLIHKDLT